MDATPCFGMILGLTVAFLCLMWLCRKLMRRKVTEPWQKLLMRMGIGIGAFSIPSSHLNLLVKLLVCRPQLLTAARTSSFGGRTRRVPSHLNRLMKFELQSTILQSVIHGAQFGIGKGPTGSASSYGWLRIIDSSPTLSVGDVIFAPLNLVVGVALLLKMPSTCLGTVSLLEISGFLSFLQQTSNPSLQELSKIGFAVNYRTLSSDSWSVLRAGFCGKRGTKLFSTKSL
ncbi:hypothetical protein LINPERHAP2_LOCUS26220 [Linum perenne]